MFPALSFRVSESRSRSFSIEPLENRQLMSALPWGNYAQLTRQDDAFDAYPTITGKGIGVAVIDCGVDYKQAVLGGGIGAGHKVVAGWNFMDNNSDPWITPGQEPHGTGVAGMLAANGYFFGGTYNQGIAPGVNLIALKQHSNIGVKAAMDWVIAHKSEFNIQVVCFIDFIGSGPWKSVYAGEMQTLANMGVFLTSSAGNQGPGVPIENPGLDPNDYVAGGINALDQVASFSQRGAGMDILAPAENVTLPYNTIAGAPIFTNRASGTSWAAPAIAGTAALIKQINPQFTPQQIMAILRDSGKQVYDPISKMTFPRLDIYGALTLAYSRAGQSQTIVPPAPTPSPTVFSKQQIVMQAERYNSGTFNDTDDINLGGVFRSDGVDIGGTMDVGAGYAVGWTHSGEWLNYTINIEQSGTFNLDFRVAAPTDGASFHMNVDGKDVTGTMEIAGTGGWQEYRTLSKSGVNLTAGSHTFTMVFDGDMASGFSANFNWFAVTEM